MRYSDTVRLALRVLRRNKGRTIITILGLAIGVAALIATVSFGRAARMAVGSQFATLGAGTLRVRPVLSVNVANPRHLDDTDVRILQRQSTVLDGVVPVYQRTVQLEYQGRSHRTGLQGMPPAFRALRPEPIDLGGAFDENDEQQRAKVCVLGRTVLAGLFGGADPLGKVIAIDGRVQCRVVGVFAARGRDVDGNDQDDRVVMPLRSFQEHMGASGGYSVLQLRVKSGVSSNAALVEVTSILRSHHQLEGSDYNDFQVISPDQIIQVADQVSATLTALLAAISALSLVVGGIGIMNIQLMSVAERVHEIGVRAAIGASPQQILAQFLFEAVALATVGSMVGVSIGLTLAFIVAQRLGWPSLMQPDVVLQALLFGVGMGALAGYMPARRAAGLDVIEALRRE